MKKALIYLYFAWLIACLATLGSIALGELQHKYPCILCWIQRLCMFPLAYILGIAFVKRNALILPYVALLPIIGSSVSLYHIAVQEIPQLEPVRICGMGPSCAIKHDIGLSFITMPMLSLLSFLLVITLLSLSYKKATLLPCLQES